MVDDLVPSWPRDQSREAFEQLRWVETVEMGLNRFAVLGQARLVGRDNLGGSMWNPPAHAPVAVRDAFAVKLQWLLGHPAIVAALDVTTP